MSSTLHLTVDEYDRMVAYGAFDHLNRKIELMRGEICEMNPTGPVQDDFINYLLNWSIRETSHQAVQVTAQTGLDLAELESRLEPDCFGLKRAVTATDILVQKM